MRHRSFLSLAAALGLMSAPLAGACSSSSSGETHDAGPDRSSSGASSGGSSGSGSSSGSGGSSGSSSGAPHDSGNDVTITEGGTVEGGVEGGGPDGSGGTDGPATDSGGADGTTPDSGGAEAGVEASVEASVEAAVEASVEASAEAAAEAGGSDAGAEAETGPGCTQLTVKNFDTWCFVSVAGGTSTRDAVQTVCVPPGSVTLAASAAPGFELGSAPWHDTSGDPGSGDPGTVNGGVDSTTVIVGSAAKCVWACCPFPDGTGCAIPDPCP